MPPATPVVTLSPDAVGWVRVAADVFANADGFGPSATNGGVTVVSGDVITEPLYLTGYRTTWSTHDGTSWKESAIWSALQSEYLDSLDVTTYGSGFLAFASKDGFGNDSPHTNVYSSADGDTWQQIASIDGVSGGDVAAAGDHLVLIASDANLERSLWTSSNGNDWVRDADRSAGRIAAIDTTLAGSTLGFFAIVPTDAGLNLWRSADGQAWTIATTFPGPPDFTGDAGGQIVAGERGLVLAASFETDSNPSDMSWGVKDMAWWSSDGTVWESVAQPPTDVTAMVAYDDGFIAGAYAPSGGCCSGTGIWDGLGRGLTWVSGDGKSWRLVRSAGWKNQWLHDLVIIGDTLVGLTTDPASESLTPGGLWLANLDTFRE